MGERTVVGVVSVGVGFGPASFLGSVEVSIRPVMPNKHPSTAQRRPGAASKQRRRAGWHHTDKD